MVAGRIIPTGDACDEAAGDIVEIQFHLALSGEPELDHGIVAERIGIDALEEADGIVAGP